MCTKFCEIPFIGSRDNYMFVADRQTNRQMNDNHIQAGKIFLLFEKITSPTH